MAVKLPRLNFNWREQPQLFERYWSDAMKSIEDNLNAVLEATGLATDAQGTADTAQVTAATAQNRADDAYDLADTKVTKDVGPSFGGIANTISRAFYTTFQRSGGWAGLTADQKIEELADGLEQLSQRVGAVITDLRANHSLTN